MSPEEPASRDAAVEQRMQDPRASTVEKVLAIVEGVAEGFAEQSRAGRLPEVAGQATQKALETAQEVRSGVAQGGPVGPLTSSSTTTRRVEEGAQTTARVAETVGQVAGRASEARAAISFQTRESARRVGADIRRTLAGTGILVFFGLTAFMLLSLALAAGLNLILGSPWGTLLVGIAYAVLAAIGYAQARKGALDASRHTRHGVESVRAEVTTIAEPLRDLRSGRPQA